MFVAYASHRNRLPTVRGVSNIRVESMEMAEEKHGRTPRARDYINRTSVLRNAHEEVEPVHQLWQLVSHV